MVPSRRASCQATSDHQGPARVHWRLLTTSDQGVEVVGQKHERGIWPRARCKGLACHRVPALKAAWSNLRPGASCELGMVLSGWSRGDGGLGHALVARRPSTPTITKAGRERGKTKLFLVAPPAGSASLGPKQGGCKTRGCPAECIVPRLLGRSIPFGRGTKAKRGIDFQAGRGLRGSRRARSTPASATRTAREPKAILAQCWSLCA
jgi:hypothetical protein